MGTMVMSTDIRQKVDCHSQWQDVVCKMIHNVQVREVAPHDFSANITGRRIGDVSCSRFWSKPHEILCNRESFGDAGGAGYLMSWQVQGDACIEQDRTQIRLTPGSLAIVDGRRPMHISFPQEVRRIVTKLPARLLEKCIPSIVRTHVFEFRPHGFISDLLLSYLSEISNTSSELDASDLPVLAENICNLLGTTAMRGGFDQVDSKALRVQAVLRRLRQEAHNPDISLDAVARQLNMSRRLIQKILQEMDTSFTSFITEERLQFAAKQLEPNQQLPISQIAYSSGFNDVSHFNHLFKRHFGVTPSDYRASLIPGGLHTSLE